MNYLLQGFLLGIAYVAPIGMQNMYVIDSALVKPKKEAYIVTFTTIFFDITLALSCYFGMGYIIEQSEIIKGIVLLVGSIAVIYIGVSLIRSTPKMDNNLEFKRSKVKTIGSIFALTWLNPQALIDGALLLGGIKTTLPSNMSVFFISGVLLASFIWFTSLTTLIILFKNIISVKVLKIINIVSGIIIIVYGIKLARNFISMFL